MTGDVLDFLARQRLKGNCSYFSIKTLSRKLKTSESEVRAQCNQLRSAPFFGLEFTKIKYDMEYRLKISKIIKE